MSDGKSLLGSYSQVSWTVCRIEGLPGASLECPPEVTALHCSFQGCTCPAVSTARALEPSAVPTFQPRPAEPGPEAVTSGCSHRTKASQSLRDLVASGPTGPHPPPAAGALGACGETVECPRADHMAEPRQLCGHLAQAKHLDLPQSLASIPNPLLMPPSVGCWPQWTDSHCL